jgi:hypothetical protein
VTNRITIVESIEPMVYINLKMSISRQIKMVERMINLKRGIDIRTLEEKYFVKWLATLKRLDSN